MTQTLPATHLLRRFLLFMLTVVLLLTLLRAVYALANYPAIVEQDALVSLFLQGLRFDIATVGFVCFVPVVLGGLLGMYDATREVARVLVSLALLVGLAFVLLTEYVTPWFLDTIGARPGVSDYTSVTNPVVTIVDIFKSWPVIAGVGLLLLTLILAAFWSRLEVSRLLRFPLGKGAGLAVSVLGGLVCLLAIWSGSPVGSLGLQPPLTVSDALITADEKVNELVMNSAFKTLSSGSDWALSKLAAVDRQR